MFLGFILLVGCFAYGAYANPLWKACGYSEMFANGIWRALIGIPAWVAVICLMISRVDIAFKALLVTIIFMLSPILKLKRVGNLTVKTIVLLVGASMGVYSRIILCWSFIGLPAARLTKQQAEVDAKNMFW